MNFDSFSLSELNLKVQNAIHSKLPDSYWIRAETSDVRLNQNGHCYLEFIEKDKRGQNIVARARGTIWSTTYGMLSAYFRTETGREFASGLSVLVKVSVEFHELYGYSLSVVDIDPTYTIGEIARNRQLILQQLEADGVLTLNKEIELTELPNRIAVISSPTAAGFEDFQHQLKNNALGFVFHTKLFPAIMQGERTEQSVIDALDQIYQYIDFFDAVVIIRGGGASADLSCFDSYLLGANCAQFPLPIISGIGHERDVTVIDAVAHTRVKTPTAAAEFLIGLVSDSAMQLMDLQHRLIERSKKIIEDAQNRISEISKIITQTKNFYVKDEIAHLQQLTTNLKYSVRHFLQNQKHIIADKEQYITMVSPQNILKRGYTLTLKNGKIIKSKVDISANENIETLFYDGKIESIVTKK